MTFRFLCVAVGGCLWACVPPPTQQPDDHTYQRPLPAGPVPFWEQWPRPTVSNDPAQIQALHANLVIGGGGPTDEGRGPFAREALLDETSATIAAMKAQGIHWTGWMEGHGQTRTFLGALHRQGDGSLEQNPRTGAARLMATQWGWDFAGPGVNPSSNQLVWLGVHTFVDNEPWAAPFVLQQTPGLSAPTYPDGRSAQGYTVAGSQDPRHARLYDATCARGLDDQLPWTYDFLTLNNRTGFLQADLGPGRGVQPIADMSIGKDVNAPFWLDYAKDVIAFALRQRTDGFWMDNSTGWDSMGGQPNRNAFGHWSVAAFRDYLARHPEVPVPGDRSTFDVRAHLRAQFARFAPGKDPNFLDSPGWSDPRFALDPIWRAFVAFKGETGQRYTKENYLALKRQAGSRAQEVYLGGNDIPDLTLGALDGDEMDQVNTEYNPFGQISVENSRGVPPLGHTGPYYATAVSLMKSRHAIVWYYLDEPSLRGKPNLGEVLGFEALANNVLLNTDTQWNRSPGTLQSMAKVNRAIAALAPVFGQRDRKGSVALVFGSFTQAVDLLPGGPIGAGAARSSSSRSHLDASLGFAGWAEALEARHTPYRVIADYKLPAGIPDDVSVLVLLHLKAIDASTIESVLMPFLRRGGAVLVSGDDSGSVATRASAYADNSGALLRQLTEREVAPGVARFISGNPGFELYRGVREGNATRAAAGRAEIEAQLSSLETAGVLNRELEFAGWGSKVWGTVTASATGGKVFVDLLNVDLNLATDALAPASGGPLHIVLPRGLATANTHLQWHDPDSLAATTLLATAIDERTLALQVPTFRVYGSLVIETAPQPTITRAGTGCDDHFCIWLLGERFGDAPTVRVFAGQAPSFVTYSGADLVLDPAAHSIAFSLKGAERALLAQGALRVQVVAAGAASNVVTVTRPVAGTAPVLEAAGPGCDDGLCVWAVGEFSAAVAVELLDSASGPVRSTYRDEQVVVNAGTRSVAIRLRVEDQQRFLAGPLWVRLRGVTTGLVSSALEVRRPVEAAPAPEIRALGPGCDDNDCLWIVGRHLDASVEVEIVEQGQVMAVYADARRLFDAAQGLITLRLAPGSAELLRFASSPLSVRLHSTSTGLRSAEATVSRP